jgi:hypothetical protein
VKDMLAQPDTLHGSFKAFPTEGIGLFKREIEGLRQRNQLRLGGHRNGYLKGKSTPSS